MSPVPATRPTDGDAADPAVGEPATHPASELVRRADQQRWADVRPHLAAMEVVVDALQGRTDGAVLVVGGRDAAPWSAILADQWPSLRVSTVQLPDDASTTHARLTVEGPFDLVVDASDENGNEQALLFERVFMHLRRGGEYVARRLVPLALEAPRPPRARRRPSPSDRRQR